MKSREATPEALASLQEAVREQRDLEMKIADTESDLSTFNKELLELRHKKLPELFMSVGVDVVGLPAEGNYPGYDAKMTPYYKASIPKEWDDKRREAALSWLRKNGYEDIIKNTITIHLNQGEDKLLARILKGLEKMKVEAEVKQGVPWQSLTAVVMEMSEAGKTPPTDILGATIGTIVRLKERKD